MTTIKAFLESIQLQQYYDAFLNAGATDNDLEQLVAFNEKELTEFLSVLDMLPFHSIKLKKRLRELKLPHPQENSATANIVDELPPLPSTREFIISHATIYGKKKNRSLTSYEEAINSAALQLALENPLLISKKGDLFDLAKKKLLQDGYRYKRGSSRSKLKETECTYKKQTTSNNNSSSSELILAKRQENAKHMSVKRLEKIKLLQYQAEQALQNRQTTENKLAGGDSFDTLTRLSLKSDLIHYEETKVKLTKEISKLKAQERKHQWYKRRKLERTTSSSQSTDEGFSSQASSCIEEENNNTTYNYSSRHSSAFSVCIPSSSQEYHGDDEQDTLKGFQCSRESDVRASSISDYDR